MLRFVRRNYSTILTWVFFASVFILHLLPGLRFIFGLSKDDAIYRWVVVNLFPAFLLIVCLLYTSIFWRRLRDEYAEQLWQKAARSFAMLTLLSPWLFFGAWIFKAFVFPDALWLPVDPKVSIVEQCCADPNSVSHNQMSGIFFVIGAIWTYSPLVFLALYKWHAWRDRD